MAELSKVRFGISKAYYAVIKSDGTYDAPKPLPGAVSLSLTREGSEPEKFAADNNASYYVVPATNGGYTGTLTLALVPDTFKVDVLGELVDDNGMQIEVTDADTKTFALMYEVLGDKDKKRRAFFNCTAQRVAEGANTTSDSTTPDTQELEFTATGKDFTLAGETRPVVKGSAVTSDAAFADWYTAVPVPTITGQTGDTE
jgi:phi13 family phage major tail protein